MNIKKKPYEPPTILCKELTPAARAQILDEYEQACAAMADMLFTSPERTNREDVRDHESA